MAYWMIAALSGVNFLRLRQGIGGLTSIKARRPHQVY
jgi:hypothetical protein